MADKQALYRKTLTRAVSIMGGPGHAAETLAVDSHVVESMMHGVLQVPEWVFLISVDVVVNHDLARLGVELVEGQRPAQGADLPPTATLVQQAQALRAIHNELRNKSAVLRTDCAESMEQTRDTLDRTRKMRQGGPDQTPEKQ